MSGRKRSLAARSPESNLVLAEGTRDRLLSLTTNLVSPRLRPKHTIYVLLDETEQADVRAHLDSFGFKAELLDYESLATASSRSFRGKSFVLSSPGLALNRSNVPGRIDGALVRVLTSHSRKQIIVTSQKESDFHLQQFADVGGLLRRISDDVVSKPQADVWLKELLLELLYERHAYFAEIRRLVANSIWWNAEGREVSSIRDALRDLSKMGLVVEERGRYYTTSRLGRLVVEGGMPISQSNLVEPQEESVSEQHPNLYDDGLERERLAYFEELVLNLVEANGWTTVNGVASEAARMNVTHGTSRGKARRLLERLVGERTLTRSTYKRGTHGPMFVYYKRGSAKAADVFENKCGDCAFYSKVARRCRLWWALSRFNAPDVYPREEGLSTIARDKFANSNAGMGPSATACDFFAAKKRDFPFDTARDVCLGCGEDIEAPIAKLVRCGNCGTAYKPLSSKILVSYNYEHIFRNRYFEISGAHPPSRALLLPGEEFYGKNEWRDLMVLYPHETVRLGTDGMYVKREGGASTIQPYDRIYRVVDYGALGTQGVSELERRGVQVVRRPLQPGGAGPTMGLYPSRGFVQNLHLLGQSEELRRLLSESLLLSVVVATKRIADQGGGTLRILVNRQLLEYERMLNDENLSVTRALAYEARVNNLYWSAYKTMLRVSGLDFKSRVRDRFVREFVDSARARARGYSPANAGINYLHQRRLVQCRAANARAGIGWIGCEGIFHVAKRNPSIGLLLDLSDSFRLADREAFLAESLKFKLSRSDFVARLGRHRLWFFYPSAEGLEKLENIGSDADTMRVNYAGRELNLSETYQEFVKSFVDAIDKRDLELLQPFVYGTRADLQWLETCAA
jgi:hypothetical protein